MKLFFKIILFVGLTHVALSMRGGGAGGDTLQPGTSEPSETTFDAETEKKHLIQLLTPTEETVTTKQRQTTHNTIKDYLNNHIQIITTNSRGKKIPGYTPNAWTPDQLKAIFTDGTVKVAAQAYQDEGHMTLPKIHFWALTNFKPTEGCSQCSEDGDGQGSTTDTDDTLVPPEQTNGGGVSSTSISGSTTGTEGQDSTTDTDGTLAPVEHANGGDVSSVDSSSPTTSSTGGIGGSDGIGQHANVGSGACCTVS